MAIQALPLGSETEAGCARVARRAIPGSAAQAGLAAEMLTLQRKAGNKAVGRLMPGGAPRNETGIPDGLKSGVEALSGVSLDGVKVHYDSARPARVNALAYAQGNEIHLAPGEERHLPHEAWHVTQQATGRVAPTMQSKGGVSVNDDAGLEREADRMGARAATPDRNGHSAPTRPGPAAAGPVMQRVMSYQQFTTFVSEHPPGAETHDVFGYIAVHYDALQAAGYEASEVEIKELGFAFKNAKNKPAAASSAPTETRAEKRGMTETDAAEIAAQKGWTLVSSWKYDKTADTSHIPKGRVYTDGKSFFGADNTGHVGFGFKKFTGSEKSLAYAGNVPADETDRVVQRGTQRTEKKSEKKEKNEKYEKKEKK